MQVVIESISVLLSDQKPKKKLKEIKYFMLKEVINFEKL